MLVERWSSLLEGEGGFTGMVDQAPVAEAWRNLLPDQVKGLQYREMLMREGIILSECS